MLSSRENEQYTHMAVMENGNIIKGADEIAKAVANVVEKPTVLLIHTEPGPQYVALAVKDLTILVDKLLNRFKEHNKKFLGILITFDKPNECSFDINCFSERLGIEGREKKDLDGTCTFDHTTLAFNNKNKNNKNKKEIKEKIKTLELQLDTVYYVKNALREKSKLIAGLYLLKPLSYKQIPPITRGSYWDDTSRARAIGAVARLLSNQDRDVVLYDSRLLDIALSGRLVGDRSDLVQKYLGVKALIGIHPLYHPAIETELIIQTLKDRSSTKFCRTFRQEQDKGKSASKVDNVVTCFTELYWSLCLTMANALIRSIIDYYNLKIHKDRAEKIEYALNDILRETENKEKKDEEEKKDIFKTPPIYRVPIAFFFSVSRKEDGKKTANKKDATSQTTELQNTESSWQFLRDSVPASWQPILEWRVGIPFGQSQSFEEIILKNLSEESEIIYHLDIEIKDRKPYWKLRTILKAILDMFQVETKEELKQILWGQGKPSIIIEAKRCFEFDKTILENPNNFKLFKQKLQQKLQENREFDLCKEVLTYIRETIEMFLE